MNFIKVVAIFLILTISQMSFAKVLLGEWHLSVRYCQGIDGTHYEPSDGFADPNHYTYHNQFVFNETDRFSFIATKHGQPKGIFYGLFELVEKSGTQYLVTTSKKIIILDKFDGDVGKPDNPSLSVNHLFGWIGTYQFELDTLATDINEFRCPRNRRDRLKTVFSKKVN